MGSILGYSTHWVVLNNISTWWLLVWCVLALTDLSAEQRLHVSQRPGDVTTKAISILQIRKQHYSTEICYLIPEILHLSMNDMKSIESDLWRPTYRITPHTTRTFIHCRTYVKEGVRVINGYINQNIFYSDSIDVWAWSKILWWVPIVYWPVTMTTLWWLPFWYPGRTRSCLKIDFSRTVNWYHLHSDPEHYKHSTI